MKTDPLAGAESQAPSRILFMMRRPGSVSRRIGYGSRMSHGESMSSPTRSPWLSILLLVAGTAVACPRPRTESSGPPQAASVPASQPERRLETSTVSKTIPEGNEPASDAEASSVEGIAKAALMRHLGLASADDIEVESVEAVDWPDASLGCGETGFGYAAVITPGHRVKLAVNGKSYSVHQAQQHAIVCKPPGT